MATWRRHLPWLAPTASSLLLFTAFLPGQFAWAGFTWAIPLALWSATEPSWKTWRRATGLAALITWSIILIWLRHVYPPLGWLGWIIVSSYCALYLFTWLLALRWIFPTLGGRNWAYRLLAIMGLAGLWIGLEALRGWALTGFGWLPLAASQVSNPVMLSLCEVTGQLGLSGAVILGNLAVARWIRRQIVERRDVSGPQNILTGLTPEIYLGFAPVALAFAIHVEFRLSLINSIDTTHDLRVAAVQTDVDPNAKWDSQRLAEQLESLRELTRDAGRTKPDFILLPEAAIAVLPLRHPGYLATLRDLSQETGCPIVLGALEERKEEYANAIAAVGPEGVIGLPYAKRHLVPFGEYVPLADWLPLRKVVPISRDCLRGMNATPILLSTRAGDTVILGPLVCYEDVFPELARDHALAGADVLVVLTNDAWYGRELGAWQHAAHSSLLAAATRLPVVRCGNAGWSGSMDTLGRGTPVLREGTVYFQGGFALSSVSYNTQRRETPTFWVRHGDWITPPSIALFALAVLMRRRLKISPVSTQTPS